MVFFVTSFFKADEQQELLKKVDTHLLVWNHTLVDLDNGERTILADMDADTLAGAAKELSLKRTKNKKNLHIALYLPNIEFIATEYELPGVAVQNITQALTYQMSDLMPAYPGRLMLAVNHIESRDKNIALWLDYNRTEALFSAFNEQAIELVSIIPRIMLAPFVTKSAGKKNHVAQFREHDDNNLLQMSLYNKNLTQWHSISNNDINDHDSYQQWENEADALPETWEKEALINSADFWQKMEKNQLLQLHYAFFPEAALRNLKKYSRLKKGRLAVLAGIIGLMLLAAPFVQNSIRYTKYEQRYQEYKDKTIEIRKMRNSVTQFEDNWALFINYPRIGIIQVIDKLNTVIPKNSWIKGFEIKGGQVEIDGYSPNPTQILELISKQKEFESAAFNQRTRSDRGKNNEHFGITFRLKDVNLEDYQEQYFPVN